MLEKFEPNCCIPTCRILRDVFARFGYAAEALPCAVLIQNAAMLEYYASTVPEEEEEERVRVYARLGAWRIDVMLNSNKSRGFEGHVVICVEHMLVDASLQQVDRPVKKVFMPPLLAFEPCEAFFDKPSGQGVVGIVNGCSVAYQRLTDYRFHNSPLWLDEGWPYSDVHKKIVRSISHSGCFPHSLYSPDPEYGVWARLHYHIYLVRRCRGVLGGARSIPSPTKGI
jgi:hypothetical protein